jgi:hypothetical protein
VKKSRPVRRLLFGVALVAVTLVASTCGSPPTVVPPPDPGTLQVNVSTKGSDPDQDGYTVALDSGSPQNVAPNGSLTFGDVEPGGHQLTLDGVADNCSAGPSNPLSVSVQSSATTTVTFEVDCGVIMASAGGTAATPDGKARVDVPSGALSDTTIISVVPAADSLLPSPAPGYVTGSAYHYRPDGTQFSKPVQITIVYDPANVPSGASESSVRLHTVENGQWVPVSGSVVDTSLHTVTGQTTHFSIYGAVAAQPGVLEVISATSGAKLDPDGYQVSVDGGAGQALAINDTLDLAGLSVGDHIVQLDSVASNCTVSGSNPRTVSVPAQDTARTTFTVTCSSQTGDLQVSASTSGSNQDPDGYAVVVDSGVPQALAINGTLTLQGLAAGSHLVQLDSVAANCTVSGANPRSVNVPDGGTASTTFDVSCVQNLGSLEVTAVTTGTDLDPNGYQVGIDGGISQTVGTNGSVVFPNLTAGDHVVTLSGVASNCTVGGFNPRTITVTYGDTASTTFDVTCSPLPGSLVVNASTTGSDLDANGYQVVVDGGAGVAVSINGSVTIPNLSAGSHQVQLTDVAGNCTVSGSNPRTVSVPNGGSTSTTFSVSCSAIVGSVQASASTSGTDQDPDGYTVQLDSGTPVSIGINGSHTFNSVSVGSHTVTLGDVATNCSVSGGTSKNVNVQQGQTATASFSVICSADVGSVQASASTSGTNQDASYTVSLDGGSTQTITKNGSYTFTNVAVGSHTVTLGDVAANCSVSGGTSRNVNVTYGNTATASFSVSCSANIGNLQVTASTSGSDPDADGYTVTIDGSLSQHVGSNASVTFNNLDVGTHSVQIETSSVASNCTVGGSNPRNVDVTFNATATTTFSISCVARVGSVQASASTSGVDQDASYTVSLDGGSTQTITKNGSYTFTNVSEGSHSVTLGDVAANCTVSGSNPQDVNVTYGNTATASFSVSCVANMGSIEASNTTSGSDLDPDGYQVSVDGGAAQTMVTNGNTTFSSIAAGSRSVQLDEATVAPNCSVTPPNPQTVSVTYGNTATASFSVSCVANVGSIEATTSTTGANIPTNFSVSMDGGGSHNLKADAGSYIFDPVSVGTHSVTLTVPANCTVTPPNPQSVNVTFGNQATAAFTATCS